MRIIVVGAGVPTPANRALQDLAAHMGRTGEPPASRTIDDVVRSIDAA